jgi:hypothetical protein
MGTPQWGQPERAREGLSANSTIRGTVRHTQRIAVVDFRCPHGANLLSISRAKFSIWPRFAPGHFFDY